jgi:stage V sporulation protein B
MFSGILNGFGEQLFIFKTGLLSGIINIFFIYFLIPFFGIPAFLAGWTISTVAISFLSALKIKKYTNKPMCIAKFIHKPVLSAVLAILLSYLLKNILYTKINFTFTSLICITAMCLIYLAVLYICQDI